MKTRRNCVRSKGKPKYPLTIAERGRLGGVALREKRLNGRIEAPVPPRQSAFFLEGEEIRHSRCREPLYFRGSGNGGEGMEASFFCSKCVESVSIPLLVLAKVLQ